MAAHVSGRAKWPVAAQIIECPPARECAWASRGPWRGDRWRSGSSALERAASDTPTRRETIWRPPGASSASPAPSRRTAAPGWMLSSPASTALGNGRRTTEQRPRPPRVLVPGCARATSPTADDQGHGLRGLSTFLWRGADALGESAGLDRSCPCTFPPGDVRVSPSEEGTGLECPETESGSTTR